jgi:hypothetical protein
MEAYLRPAVETFVVKEPGSNRACDAFPLASDYSTALREAGGSLTARRIFQRNWNASLLRAKTAVFRNSTASSSPTHTSDIIRVSFIWAEK